MTMNVSRRDVLRFAAGGAVGAMLTPVPWKALDDVAIWTQNWSWIPKPPRGAVTMRATACALCPAACAVEARCIGGLPVSMHARGGGGLCPSGLTGHHLPYHPSRLSRTLRLFHSDGVLTRRIPVQLDAAIAAAGNAMRDASARSQHVAVLDMRPGRSVSWAWRRFLTTVPQPLYISAPAPQFPPGADLGAAATIVSFRAPIVEGWGGPELRTRVIDRKVNLIQIDPTHSATASIASRWIPARPGSEALLALAFAGTIPPEVASKASGVPAEVIDDIRRQLQAGPAIAIAEGGLGRRADLAIADLNAALGNGAVASTELPPPLPNETIVDASDLANVADRSIALLLIDMTAGDQRFPWAMVRQKLAPSAVVVALSPFLAGTATRADYVVPSLPYLETIHELPAAFDAAAPRLTLSAAILPPRHEAIDPVAFIRAIAPDLPGDWPTSEQLMRARVASIHKAGKGSVGDKEVKELASASELWDALIAGASWNGVRNLGGSRPPLSTGLTAAAGAAASADEDVRTPKLTLVVRTPPDVASTAAVSPVMSKLYRESALRRPPDAAVINPDTARQLGLLKSQRAMLIVAGGSLRVTIATDHGVMPGIVEMTVAPDPVALGEKKAMNTPGILDVISPDANGSWRTIAARLEA